MNRNKQKALSIAGAGLLALGMVIPPVNAVMADENPSVADNKGNSAAVVGEAVAVNNSGAPINAYSNSYRATVMALNSLPNGSILAGMDLNITDEADLSDEQLLDMARNLIGPYITWMNVCFISDYESTAANIGPWDQAKPDILIILRYILANSGKWYSPDGINGSDFSLKLLDRLTGDKTLPNGIRFLPISKENMQKLDISIKEFNNAVNRNLQIDQLTNEEAFTQSNPDLANIAVNFDKYTFLTKDGNQGCDEASYKRTFTYAEKELLRNNKDSVVAKLAALNVVLEASINNRKGGIYSNMITITDINGEQRELVNTTEALDKNRGGRYGDLYIFDVEPSVDTEIEIQYQDDDTLESGKEIVVQEGNLKSEIYTMPVTSRHTAAFPFATLFSFEDIFKFNEIATKNNLISENLNVYPGKLFYMDLSTLERGDKNYSGIKFFIKELPAKPRIIKRGTKKVDPPVPSQPNQPNQPNANPGNGYFLPSSNVIITTPEATAKIPEGKTQEGEAVEQKDKRQEVLPKTGEISHTPLYTGILALASTILAVLGKKRKRQE